MSLANIHGKGKFHFDKGDLKFKGSLKYKNHDLGLISIRKTSLTDLKLKFNDNLFEDMNSLCNHLSKICNTNFGTFELTKPILRKKIEKNDKKIEVIDDVIKDIKTHTECTIW